MLSDVTILNATGILNMATTKKSFSCAATGSMDIFYCGLYGDK
jgi:hypothetical protein